MLHFSCYDGIDTHENCLNVSHTEGDILSSIQWPSCMVVDWNRHVMKLASSEAIFPFVIDISMH